MNINLHIERLVLDGLPMETEHGPLIQQAVERELTTLLTNSQLPDALRSGGSLYRLQTPEIQISYGVRPVPLGQQIAGAVYKGLSK
ncbi:MAG: hypothetical protein WBX11_14690 [Thiobacillaceae bacterium]